MTKTLSVTSARQQLLKLTKDISRRMDQVVLTNKGEAQAILMSVGEYKSLRAAAELLSHPEARRASDQGFEELRRGEGIRLAEAMPARSAARKKWEAAQPAEAKMLSAEPVLVVGKAGRNLEFEPEQVREVVRRVEEEERTPRTTASLRRGARGSGNSRKADLNKAEAES